MPYKKKSAVEKSPTKKSKTSSKVFKKNTVCALIPANNASETFRLAKLQEDVKDNNKTFKVLHLNQISKKKQVIYEEGKQINIKYSDILMDININSPDVDMQDEDKDLNYILDKKSYEDLAEMIEDKIKEREQENESESQDSDEDEDQEDEDSDSQSSHSEVQTSTKKNQRSNSKKQTKKATPISDSTKRTARSASKSQQKSNKKQQSVQKKQSKVVQDISADEQSSKEEEEEVSEVKQKSNKKQAKKSDSDKKQPKNALKTPVKQKQQGKQPKKQARQARKVIEEEAEKSSSDAESDEEKQVSEVESESKEKDESQSESQEQEILTSKKKQPVKKKAPPRSPKKTKQQQQKNKKKMDIEEDEQDEEEEEPEEKENKEDNEDENEDEHDNEDAEEDDEGEEESGKKKKQKKKQDSKKPKKEKKQKEKKKPQKFKKGVFNPKIEKIPDECKQLESSDNQIEDSCCVKCTNKELIRAIYSHNKVLLRSILKSQNQISTLFERWGPELDFNALELIFEAEDQEGLKLICEAIAKKNTPDNQLKLTKQPKCSLKQINTGYNTKFAYGAATRKVQLGRGNKEGNNAFVYDLENENDITQYSIQEIVQLDTDKKLFDLLRTCFNSNDTTNIDQMLFSGLALAVRSGNYKIAGYLIAAFNKKGNVYGFNQLHEEVLNLTDASKLKPFKKNNCVKKSQKIFRDDFFTPIHCACINPNPDILKALLETSQEYNIADNMLRKPVHYAAACKHSGPLEFLIKNGVDTREGDKTKITPLMIACHFGRVENVKVLLADEQRSNVNAKARDGMGSVHFAAKYGHLDILKILNNKKVDMKQPGSMRMTPLHFASAYGHIDCVKYLIEEIKLKPMAKDKFKRSPLMMAVRNGNLEIAAYLLQNGAPYDEADSSFNTSLHYAAAYGFRECIDILVQAGANLNSENSWKLTPLSVAIQKNHYGIVKQLLNFPETQVDCKDDTGRTIVSNQIEILTDKNYEQVKYLLEEKKANPNIQDLKGWTALHYACNINYKDIPQEFAEDPYKWNEVSEEEKEVYYQKQKEMMIKMIELLLKNNADVNIESTDHQTPLSRACEKKNSEVMNILLDNPNIDLDKISANDETIFHKLSSIIVSPEGEKIFKKICNTVKNKDLLVNFVDSKGFTPILKFIQQYSKNAQSQYDQIFAKISEKHLLQKIKEIENQKGVHLPLQRNMSMDEEGCIIGSDSILGQGGAKISDDSVDGNGGARVMQTARKSTGGMAPRKQMACRKFGVAHKDDEMKKQEVALTKEELEEVTQEAIKQFQEYENNFIELLQNLIGMGANMGDQVQKLKKYRDIIGMEIEEGQPGYESDENDKKQDEEEDQDNNPFKQKRKKYRYFQRKQLFGGFGKQGNYYNQDSDEDEDEKKKEKKKKSFYCENGMQNALHLCSDFPSMKLIQLIINSEKVDINHKDYKQRTPFFVYLSNPKQFLLNFHFQNEVQLYKYLIEKKADVLIQDINGVQLIELASKNEDFTTVKLLIQNGANLNIRNLKGEVPLLYWVKKRHLKNVEELLNLGGDPNFTDDKKRSALHHAVNEANVTADASFELEQILINRNAKINSLDLRNRTPLHYAFVKIGKPLENSPIDPIETVSSLVAVEGCEVNIKDAWGKTALHYASQRGAKISGLFLINNKADINIEDEDKNTPLGIALINGHEGIATFLIQNKASLSKIANCNLQQKKKDLKDASKNPEPEKQKSTKQNQFGFGGFGYQKTAKKWQNSDDSEEDESNKAQKNFVTPGQLQDGQYSLFKIAILYGWQGMAYLLIQNGYSLMHAITDALNSHKFQLVLTLLTKTKKDEAQKSNEHNQNLFHIFSINGSNCNDDDLNSKIFNELTNRGVKFDQIDKYGREPFHYGCEHGFEFLAIKMLEKKCSPNLKDKEDDTPFSLIIKFYSKNNSFNQKVLDVFFENQASLKTSFKASVGFKEKIRFLPFVYVVANGLKDQNLLKYFIDNGSDINEQDELGLTPLMYAIKENSVKLVRFFLQHPGLNKNLTDYQGNTPIHYIINPIEYGSYENIKMLNLVAQQFDVKQANKKGITPMALAQQQDSGTLVAELKKLGCDDAEPHVSAADRKVKRAATSVIAYQDWPSEEVDFEEDAEKYLTQEQQKEAQQQVLNVNPNQQQQKVKPDEDAYEIGHVEVMFDDMHEPYDAVMTKVDIKNGYYSENVFYKMQLLHEINRNTFVVLTRWGRIGDQGQHQLTPFGSKDEAVKEFEKIFQEKTKNAWSNKNSFVKQPKKYQLMVQAQKIQHKDYLKPINYNNPLIPDSSLTENMQIMIKQFADVNLYQKFMVSWQIDTDFLPLQALSKNQLFEAKQILQEINDLIEEVDEERKDIGQADLDKILSLQEQIADKSSRFFELIPQKQFRAQAIPPIDNKNILYSTQLMIESMINFEITTKILLGAQLKIQEINPLDYIFSCLNIKALNLEEQHPEFQLIKRYISNSQESKKGFIHNIFAIERKGEAERIAQWKHLTNRQILWHGSSAANFIGILSQGLRVSPPEAIQTGQLFGKGIYFADTFTKSYGYTGNLYFDGKQEETENFKYLLLCEVALGQMYTPDQDKPMVELPAQFNSCLGKGGQGPNPKQQIVLQNGAIMPVGKVQKYEQPQQQQQQNQPAFGGGFIGGKMGFRGPAKRGGFVNNLNLSYNEYIVYNESQVRMRYLIQINANYE